MSDTSVYVHFPWCLKKCPYCDFATRATDWPAVPHRAYADAVIRELDARAASLEGRRLSSVFFGGGTPSVWEASELGRVLGAIMGAFDAHDDDVEVTVECNPSSLDEAKADALVSAGVGRLSIGIQSLDDARLRFLGRYHDAAGAMAALLVAKKTAPRASADFMFGMPGQTREAIVDELSRVLDLGMTHVSAYALTIEPGTQFGELHRKGKLTVAGEDDYADMFGGAEDVFARYGLEHYEVSNYAAPGDESRHNLHYWRGRPYVGLGAAAVGCLEAGPGRARRWKNVAVGERYLERMASGLTDGPEAEQESLDARAIVREALMLGLRTREGVDLAHARERAGVEVREGRERAIARRVESGDLVDEGTRLRVPRTRWLHLDTIVADLF